MNASLWITLSVLGLFFTVHGILLLLQPPKAQKQLEALPFSKGFLHIIGLAELLGGLGLILPWWLGIATFLTPLAGLGLAIIMTGAFITHMRHREGRQSVVSFVFSALLFFTVWWSVFTGLSG